MSFRYPPLRHLSVVSRRVRERDEFLGNAPPICMGANPHEGPARRRAGRWPPFAPSTTATTRGCARPTPSATRPIETVLN
jgi:hypothetical protein